jgi:hypothetical protein
MIQRRTFLKGLGSLLAAPAVVKAASLMPVRGIVQAVPGQWTYEIDEYGLGYAVLKVEGALTPYDALAYSFTQTQEIYVGGMSHEPIDQT